VNKLTRLLPEEVCEGCVLAEFIEGLVFWDGQPRFARCMGNHENDVNNVNGECPYK